MMEDGENKAIGAFACEKVDTVSHRLKEADFSDKHPDPIMIDMSQQMDKQGNGR
jgi:hypothetical protein